MKKQPSKVAHNSQPISFSVLAMLLKPALFWKLYHSRIEVLQICSAFLCQFFLRGVNLRGLRELFLQKNPALVQRHWTRRAMMGATAAAAPNFQLGSILMNLCEPWQRYWKIPDGSLGTFLTPSGPFRLSSIESVQRISNSSDI